MKNFNSKLYKISEVGDYNLTGIVSDTDDEYGNNDTLRYTLNKIHQLDAGVALGTLNQNCNNDVEATIIVTNNGGSTINSVQFEIIVNDESAGYFNEQVDISSLSEEKISVIVDANFQANDNEVAVSFISINGQIDQDSSNDYAVSILDVQSTYDYVTLIINGDSYPYEISWAIIDFNDNTIASGELGNGVNDIEEEICLDYTSCYSLFVYDSYGDGILGDGDFS